MSVRSIPVTPAPKSSFTPIPQPFKALIQTKITDSFEDSSSLKVSALSQRINADVNVNRGELIEPAPRKTDSPSLKRFKQLYQKNMEVLPEEENNVRSISSENNIPDGGIFEMDL